MAVTGRDVYKLALCLMGERPDARNIEDYTGRAVPLINLILTEIRSFVNIISETEDHAAQDRTEDLTAQQYAGAARLDSLDDQLDIDGRLAAGIIPYALAARLILEEDPQRADYFDAQYEKNLRALKNRGRIVPIKRVCF